MIRLLFYIDTLKAGGAEKVLANLVNAIDPDRFALTVATPFPEDRSALGTMWPISPSIPSKIS